MPDFDPTLRYTATFNPSYAVIDVQDQYGRVWDVWEEIPCLIDFPGNLHEALAEFDPFSPQYGYDRGMCAS